MKRPGDDQQTLLPASDPWWGTLDLDEGAGGAAAAPAAKVSAPAPQRRARRQRRRLPLLARLHRKVRKSERLRRLFTRLMILVVVLAALACSVGVITLNNLVIRRSAELGRLENQRRTLRTENAMMAAEIAKLSAPPRIAQLARTRLGMQPASKMAAFIWLDPANRPVTAHDRAVARIRLARVKAREAAARERAQAKAQARRAAAASSARPAAGASTEARAGRNG